MATIDTRTRASLHRDERALLVRYHRHGDQRAREALVEGLLPLVRAIARRYGQRGEPLEDLIQVGCIGALKAVDRFDLDRDVKLSTFAVPNIAGEIKRHFRDHTSALRIPRDVQERAARVAAARDRLAAQLQRSPTVDEIAAALDADVEQVLEAMHSVHARRTTALDPGPGEEQDQAEPVGLDDERLGLADIRMMLDRCARPLDERERAILVMRFSLDLTQSEIAARIGVSQMQVSRLIRRALARMQEALPADGIQVAA